MCKLDFNKCLKNLLHGKTHKKQNLLRSVMESEDNSTEVIIEISMKNGNNKFLAESFEKAICKLMEDNGEIIKQSLVAGGKQLLCSICQITVSNKPNAVVYSCQHVFCPSCIKKEETLETDRCPICEEGREGRKEVPIVQNNILRLTSAEDSTEIIMKVSTKNSTKISTEHIENLIYKLSKDNYWKTVEQALAIERQWPCAMCQQNGTASKPATTVYMCHHVFCTACIKKIKALETGKCPICREYEQRGLHEILMENQNNGGQCEDVVQVDKQHKPLKLSSGSIADRRRQQELSETLVEWDDTWSMKPC